MSDMKTGLCIKKSFNRMHCRNFSVVAEVLAYEGSKRAMPAHFSNPIVQDQVNDWEKNGYVLIKMPKVESLQRATHYNLDIVKKVASEVTSQFKSRVNTFAYAFWRKFHAVNSPTKRHSIALQMTPNLRSLLNGSITYMRPFLDTQLPNKCSPLVELSAVLALPGATAQAVHTDIMFPRCDRRSDETVILTAMLALRDIRVQDGPTFLYTGSNQRSFHTKYRRHVNSGEDTFYDSYGDMVHTGYQAHGERHGTDARVDELEDVKELVPPTPVYAELSAGDILLFDAKLFHFGGANTSETSRDLLSWSFQKPTTAAFSQDEECKPIFGFTYHIDKSIKNTLVLKDFQVPIQE